MKKLIQKFHRGEEGATMVEYALMIVLIAVASIVIVTTLGGQVAAAFTSVSTAF